LAALALASLSLPLDGALSLACSSLPGGGCSSSSGGGRLPVSFSFSSWFSSSSSLGSPPAPAFSYLGSSPGSGSSPAPAMCPSFLFFVVGVSSAQILGVTSFHWVRVDHTWGTARSGESIGS